MKAEWVIQSALPWMIEAESLTPGAKEAERVRRRRASRYTLFCAQALAALRAREHEDASVRIFNPRTGRAMEFDRTTEEFTSNEVK